MDFGNFLGNIMGALPGMGASVPGFAGGQVPIGPQMQGLPMPQAPSAPPQQAMPAKKPFAEGPFGKIMGVIGDALLARSGLPAQYLPQMMQQRQRKQMGQALSNYLGNTDQGLAEMLAGGAVDPELALRVYQMTHQRPEVPGIAKEVEYYRGIGRGDLADQLLEKHAQGGPLIANNGDGTFTIVPQSYIHGGGSAKPSSGQYYPDDPAGQDGEPTVEEGYQYTPGPGGRANQQNWKPVEGGPTASPSVPFP